MGYFLQFFEVSGAILAFSESLGGFALCQAKSPPPPQSNSPSRPGVEGGPIQNAPVDQGIFLADFPFFYFFCVVEGSNRPWGFLPSQSDGPIRTRGVWTIPFKFSHLYRVGMSFWEVFQLGLSSFCVFCLNPSTLSRIERCWGNVSDTLLCL